MSLPTTITVRNRDATSRLGTEIRFDDGTSIDRDDQHSGISHADVFDACGSAIVHIKLSPPSVLVLYDVALTHLHVF